MARRCLHGLLFLALASCAAPTKSGDVATLLSDGGVNDLASGGGGGGSDAGDAFVGSPSDLSLGATCVAGGACMTANPGACAGGHISCSGAVATCVPDAMTQPCYTGGAGTSGVGVCTAGTQSCIGSLGSCNGQVVPATVENCFNDLDDDCDGKLNNGCPDHLVTGTPVGLTLEGNAAGGGAFSLRCPVNSYLTGIVIYGDSTDEYVAGLDIACATPTLTRGTAAYTVTPTAVTANPTTQRATNITTSATAPFNCGTASFNPASYAQGTEDVGGVDALGVSCSAGALALSATNQLSITFTKGASMSYGGYTQFGSAFEEDCATGQVLIGFDGRDGNWFDALTPICAPLQVVYK